MYFNPSWPEKIQKLTDLYVSSCNLHFDLNFFIYVSMSISDGNKQAHFLIKFHSIAFWYEKLLNTGVGSPWLQ